MQGSISVNIGRAEQIKINEITKGPRQAGPFLYGTLLGWHKGPEVRPQPQTSEPALQPRFPRLEGPASLLSSSYFTRENSGWWFCLRRGSEGILGESLVERFPSLHPIPSRAPQATYLAFLSDKRPSRALRAPMKRLVGRGRERLFPTNLSCRRPPRSSRPPSRASAQGKKVNTAICH